MLNMPASPAAHRRETLVRLRRVENSLDTLLRISAGEERGVAAKPSSTAAPQDPRVVSLARAMGDPLYHFPSGSKVNLTRDEDGEIVATGLTIENRFWSVRDIVKLELINDRGAWLWHRYSVISHALPPVSNDYLRPHYPATVAGRESL
jgi:hypothetical protein